MQRTWPTQTAIYSTFHNTLCQKNRQTLKTVIDAFNFVYYSFFSFHEASRNICGWPLIKLHSHSAYISLIHQTGKHRAWHFSIFITSTYSINWKFYSCSLWNIDKLLKSLTSEKWALLYKRPLRKCKPFGMTKTHWILHFPPKLPAISWFWQTY